MGFIVAKQKIYATIDNYILFIIIKTATDLEEIVVTKTEAIRKICSWNLVSAEERLKLIESINNHEEEINHPGPEFSDMLEVQALRRARKVREETGFNDSDYDDYG